MGKITKWIKKQAAVASVALSNVEKNALSQTGEGLATDVNQSTRLNQGKISDSLINGEITQEVMDLRWRMYKVMEASETKTIKLEGYDENDNPIYKMGNKNLKITKPNLDNFDPYPAVLIVNNTEIGKSVHETFDISNLEEKAVVEDTGSATRAEISGHNYFVQDKNERPIKVKRSNAPNFYLEDYTKTLKIRKIDETKHLLEFYVSLYPDEYNRASRFFISNIKKVIENPQMGGTMLEIDEVGFITDKTQGAANNHLFEYNNLVFDKIVTHNGHYVVKFIADVKTNGQYIMEGYRQEKLDTKYENKEKK